MKKRGTGVIAIFVLALIAFCGCSNGTNDSVKMLSGSSAMGNNQNSEMKNAYELYYSKLIEEYARYGLNDDSGDGFARGIMTCDLVDFDGDGLKELFYVVCRYDSEYTVCVYGFDKARNNLVSIFEENPGTHGSIMPLKGEKNNYLLSSNFVTGGINDAGESESEMEYQIWEYKNNNFETIKTYKKISADLVGINGELLGYENNFYNEGDNVPMVESEFLKDSLKYNITSTEQFDLLSSQYCGRDKHPEQVMLKVTSELLGRQNNFDEYGVNQIGKECADYLGNEIWPDVIAVTDLNLDSYPEVIVGDTSSSGAHGVIAYQFKDNQLQELELKTVNSRYFRDLDEFNDSDMKHYISNKDGSEHIFSVLSYRDKIYSISEYTKEGSVIYRTLIGEKSLLEDKNGNKVTKFTLNGKDTTEEKFNKFTEEWRTKYKVTDKLHSDYTFLFLNNNFDFQKYMFEYAIGLSTIPDNLNENLRPDEAILNVEVLDDKKAVFKLKIPGLEEFYLTDLPGSPLGSAEYEFAVKFGEYDVSLVQWAFSPGKTKRGALVDMQSSLSRNKGELQGFEYIQQNVPVKKVEESIVWELDMSQITDFNFKNINEYTVEIMCPKMTFSFLHDEQKVLTFGKREVVTN